MKPQDMLPTPLTGRPSTGLTELVRMPLGDGWETVEFQGDDGYRYRTTAKGNIERNWMVIPPEEFDNEE